MSRLPIVALSRAAVSRGSIGLMEAANGVRAMPRAVARAGADALTHGSQRRQRGTAESPRLLVSL